MDIWKFISLNNRRYSMKHLYSYTLTLPLTYCTYSLHGEDSELVLGLSTPLEWDETQHIKTTYPLDESKIFSATESIHFCLSSRFTERLSGDDKQIYHTPDKFFLCTISGIVAESPAKARELVDPFIIKACKSLSILMSCHNCNKHRYQPRVEPDYKQQHWEKEVYQPYETLVAKAVEAQEYTDENGNTVIQIYAEQGDIAVGAWVHTAITGPMDTTHFFDLYHYDVSPDLGFILDEYYMALGRESITSKFFHLFSIIEYVEKNFIHLAETDHVFDKGDKQLVREQINSIDMPKEKRNRLCSSVMDVMNKATEIGREAKLVNILHNMGITEFTECGTQFVVNKDSMKELTALRNSYYHGDGNKVETKEEYISVELAVARLMYICEGIILYVMQ
jgi:hypothetical protein